MLQFVKQVSTQLPAYHVGAHGHSSRSDEPRE